MQDMSKAEIAEVIESHGFGVISLASGDRGYGIPLFYGYDGNMFYFQSRPGMKEEFVRSTTEACLTIVRMESEEQWRSVQVVGPVRRLTREKDQVQAADVLMKLPFPPEFQYLSKADARRNPKAIFLWALKPERIVGRQSSLALQATAAHPSR